MRSRHTFALIPLAVFLTFSVAEAALSPPSSLKATAVSSSQINLSWTDNSTNESGFKIERATSSTGPWSQIFTTSANVTSYANTGLNASTTYYYRVRAYKAAGGSYSSYSNTANATTQGSTTIPAAPSKLSASAVSASQINLTWTDNSTNESGFKIERATTSTGPWSQIATTGANTTSYSNTGLSASTTYYYRVQAYNTAGNSGYSNTANATTLAGSDTTAPSVPSGLTASAASCSQVNLSWTASTDTGGSGLKGYNVYKGGVFLKQVTTTSTSDSGLTASTAYLYTVSAVDNAGNQSAQSTVASASTPACSDTTAPSVPTNLTASAASCNQINLLWTASTDTGGSELKGYNVYRGGVFLKQVTATSTSDTGLAASTAYSYTVSAVDNAGNQSAQSNTAMTNTPACPNKPPVANAGPDQTATVGTAVTFNGSGSSDPDGTITSYAWTFGDGVSATGVTVSHTYAAAGTYTATLTVADNLGAKSSDTALVTVTATSGGGGLFWDAALGGTGADIGQAIAMDANGNVVVVGSFQGTVDFGGGALTSAGGNDIFVATYSATGTLLWSQRFGSTGDDRAYAVAVDSNDNMVVTGVFQNAVNFGGGTLISAGSYDIFVAKYSATGTPLWSKRFGDATDDMGYGVAVDGSGNVVVTGYFRNTVDFGGGLLFSANGGKDTFVAKYTAAGGYLWSKNFYNTNEDMGYGVAVDGSGNVVVAGYFLGTIDFSGVQLTSAGLTSAGMQDIYVAKLSATGTHLWSQRFGSTGDDRAQAVAVDGSANVVVTGHFQYSVNFGGGALSSNGPWDIFVAKYAGVNGGHLWSQRFGGTSTDDGYSVAVDGSGNVVVVGAFQGTADFGGGPLTSAGSNDIFVAKYAGVNGGHLWSKRFGGTSSDKGSGVTVDGSGNVAVTGYFQGTVDFGGGPLTSAGSTDIFLLSLLP